MKKSSPTNTYWGLPHICFGYNPTLFHIASDKSALFACKGSPDESNKAGGGLQSSYMNSDAVSASRFPTANNLE